MEQSRYGALDVFQLYPYLIRELPGWPVGPEITLVNLIRTIPA